MKVFVSWSGTRSKHLAEIFKQWIPAVIQAAKVYYSPDDVTKGARWSAEISKELEESRIGILCLTPDNLEAPWIMFEAGAISKNIDKSKVCPILFDVEPTDITGPLVQFQACKFEKAEIKKLIKMINGGLSEGGLATDVLDSVFEMWWPQLEDKVKTELKRQDDSTTKTKRPEREMLEEVLQLVRSMSRRPVLAVPTGAVEDLIQGYTDLVGKVKEAGLCQQMAPGFDLMKKPIEFFLARVIQDKKAILAANFVKANQELMSAVPPEDTEVPF